MITFSDRPPTLCPLADKFTHIYHFCYVTLVDVEYCEFCIFRWIPLRNSVTCWGFMLYRAQFCTIPAVPNLVEICFLWGDVRFLTIILFYLYVYVYTFFTTLLAMRILSVHLSNTWIVALKFCFKTCVTMKFVDDDDDENGRKICPDFYTIRKIIWPSFQRRRMIGGVTPSTCSFGLNWPKLPIFDRFLS